MHAPDVGGGRRFPEVPGRIEILLAVHNGARYLGEQLDSLLAQSVDDWTLIARDDGSTDESRRILAAYRDAHPGKIALAEDGGARSGTLANFTALLGLSRAAHVMFCDQDDVWLPDKIAATLAVMRRLESERGAGCPVLVHTDMKVVDAGLRVVAESLWRFQRSDPVRGAPLNRLLLQNCATGCSVMINGALRDLALPIPPEAMMHDWWLALVAAAFGAIGHVAAPTLLYRQHGANDTGAKQWGVARLARQVLAAGGARRLIDERRSVLAGVRRQARAFSERYAKRLSRDQREMVAAFAGLDDLGWLGRVRSTVRHGFFYTSPARNLIRLLPW